jgi:RimJ/RimL family protein N-acetyltransferase
MTLTAPVLETPRLTLRGHRASDLEDVLALRSDPDVVRYVGGTLATRQEAWERLQRYVGHWALAGYGFWQIRERTTDRLVGEAGLAAFERGLALPFDGAPEAGWVLAAWSHGAGYATEAMTAILAWAAPIHPRTVCIIHPDNAASLRVAARLGYREFGRDTYRGAPILAFERHAAPETSPALA